MTPYQWLLAGACAALLTACSSGNENASANDNGTRRAESVAMLQSNSPAEVSCTLAGGTMALSRQLNGSNIGTCQLANGKRCDETALMNGMCPAG